MPTAPEREQLDRLFNAAYEELKRLARSAKRSRLNPAVSTGTLIHGAWLRLAAAKRFAPESEQHFKNIAAKAMRQVLTEIARRQTALKRGGADRSTWAVLDLNSLPIRTPDELLALDAALEKLRSDDPRQAVVVEQRFFGGVPETEIAAMLHVSVETVSRDWRAAKARLAADIRGA